MSYHTTCYYIINIIYYIVFLLIEFQTTLSRQECEKVLFLKTNLAKRHLTTVLMSSFTISSAEYHLCNDQLKLVVQSSRFEQTVEISSTTSLAGSQLESAGEWLTWSLLERVKSPEQPVAIKFTPMRYWVLCFLTRLCLMCCTTLLSPAPHCKSSTAKWREHYKGVIKKLLLSPWSTRPVSKRISREINENKGEQWT